MPVGIGGAQVRPGDIVGCDDDGLVVVPIEVAKQVALHAKAVLLADMRARRRRYDKLGMAPMLRSIPMPSTATTPRSERRGQQDGRGEAGPNHARRSLPMSIARPFAAAAAIAAGLTGAAWAQDQVTLDFWEGHSVQEEAATIKMIEAFEASQPNIKINRVKTSFGTNFEAITTALASGTAPDVSPIWSGFLSQFAANGALVDLTEYGAKEMTADIYPGAVDYVTWGDGIYGLPYAFDPRFLVYNEEAMAEAGITEPAKTFDEMIEQAEKLIKMNGSEVERYGFGLAAADSLAYFFVNLLYAYGGEIFNEDGSEVAFNNEAGRPGRRGDREAGGQSRQHAQRPGRRGPPGRADRADRHGLRRSVGVLRRQGNRRCGAG